MDVFLQERAPEILGQECVCRIAGASEKVRLEGVLRLRNDLFAHYLNLSPEESRRTTQLEDFTMKMLGTPMKRKLKMKGAETKGLVPFVVKLAHTHAHELGPVGRLIIIAGNCLIRFYDILDAYGRVMPDASVKEPHPAHLSASRFPSLVDHSRTKALATISLSQSSYPNSRSPSSEFLVSVCFFVFL